MIYNQYPYNIYNPTYVNPSYLQQLEAQRQQAEAQRKHWEQQKKIGDSCPYRGATRGHPPGGPTNDPWCA